MFTYILQNWNTRILYGPAIPLLGIYIYQKGMHICAKRHVLKSFTAALFKPKLLKCLSIPERIVKYSPNRIPNSDEDERTTVTCSDDSCNHNVEQKRFKSVY